VVDGQYNAVAYIENRNRDIGSPEVHYTMKLFDDQGLIAEREGVTILPPDSVYPIFEGKVITGSRVPTKTTIEFGGDIVWLPGETGREQFTLVKRDLVGVDSKPRLTAQMRNTTLDEAKDVEIIATIFDASGNPLTAARTVVDYFTGRVTKDVIFTWPEPIAKTLRSCEIPTDVMLAIDLSGSMDDDGGTPAEPIHSVLSAAESFTLRLKKNDQVGVVTYATGAKVVEKLTHESARIGDVVSALTIASKEQRGSTNIGDALKRMREELSSERHNSDARKVAILLTDGLANMPLKDPEPYALSEAKLLKDMGVEVFTIGLGGKLNEEFLKSIASSNTQYYRAPTIKEVGSIYASITKAICEDGAAVIDIIPKAGTSFTPLR
jgi:Mg-chelatase subunit ChlD